jgi:HPt (histidine-containing phosphotransfer) domain-containing protein
VSSSDLTPAVNFAYLEGVAAGDARLVDEVLEIFERQAALWAPRLDPVADDWRETLHTIKGAGRSVGAGALGDACERAEVGGALEPVRQALDAALVEIAAYRRGSGA